MSAARLFAAIGAIAAAAGLALQLGLLMQTMAPVAGVWRFFAYFTILTNGLVMLVLGRAALRGPSDGGLNSARVELMAFVSIVFVCVIYNWLLAPLWNPQGLQLIADLILHQATPAICALYWFSRPRGRLTRRDALFAPLWPIGYSIYGLTRGAFDGFYPYPFMDPTQLTLPHMALNMAALVAAFAAAALVLVGVDGALGRRAGRSARHA